MISCKDKTLVYYIGFMCIFFQNIKLATLIIGSHFSKKINIRTCFGSGKWKNEIWKLIFPKFEIFLTSFCFKGYLCRLLTPNKLRYRSVLSRL